MENSLNDELLCSLKDELREVTHKSMCIVKN